MSEDNLALPPVNATHHTYRPHLPERFDGSVDGFSALTWLRTVKRYFLATSVPTLLQTVHAVSFLGQTASRWFDGSGLADTTPFSDFETSFLAYFVPPDFSNVLWREMMSLRMTTTVEAYVQKANETLTALLATETVATREAIERSANITFLQGCPKALREILEAVQIRETLSIRDLHQSAIRYDRIYHFRPDDIAANGTAAALLARTNTQSSVVAAQLRSAPVESSAMDIDSLRMELNVLRRDLQYLRQQPRSNNGSLAPLTPAERQHLREIGGCFRCRRPGHNQYNCPSSPARRPTRVNNIGTASVPSPAPLGNGPSDQA